MTANLVLVGWLTVAFAKFNVDPWEDPWADDDGCADANWAKMRDSPSV